MGSKIPTAPSRIPTKHTQIISKNKPIQSVHHLQLEDPQIPLDMDILNTEKNAGVLPFHHQHRRHTSTTTQRQARPKVQRAIRRRSNSTGSKLSQRFARKLGWILIRLS